MKQYVSICAFLLALACSAQHESDKWYFGGLGDGLDFTRTCEPTVLSDGQISGWEGCATVSDRNTGDLIFYTNSSKVWDRSHQVMPNGDIQPPGVVISQNTISQVLPVRVPGHDSLYYIITAEIQGQTGRGMRLACVDLTLNSGFGDLLFKDSLIYADTVSEKITAIPHANGTDIWVVGHECTGDAFISRLLTSQGFAGPWVMSNVGKHYASTLTTDMVGEMKANPYGDKLAVTTYHQPHIELFDFDRETGTLSNVVLIPAQGGYDPEPSYSTSFWYGVSFSPDGSKLYAARQNSINPTDAIIQMDVTSGDSATIAASTTSISTLNDCFSLQLAPNGRIYTRRSGNFLGVINHPNNVGTSCGFDPEGVAFAYPDPVPGAWGFNNHVALTAYPCLGSAIGIEESYRLPDIMYAAPNPCSERTTVHLPSTSEAILIDLCELRSARVIKSFRTHRSSQYTMEIGDIAPGAYVIQASEQGHRIGVTKLIVEPLD